jgi:KUP system potassium uptake protein
MMLVNTFAWESYDCSEVVLVFASSRAGVAVICVMLITTLLVTLVMTVLWKLPLPIILCFLCTFGIIEGIYLTAVLNKVPQGGWVPFAIAAFFLVIMLSWIYGRQKKYEYEASRKVSKGEMHKLLYDEAVVRVPGVCLFYSDLVHGLPPIISHYVRCVGTLHQVLVFVTIRYVPVRTVLPEERFLVDRFQAYRGVYRCIARYGYMDLMNTQHATVLSEIVHRLKSHISDEEQQQQQLLRSANLNHNHTSIPNNARSNGVRILPKEEEEEEELEGGMEDGVGMRIDASHEVRRRKLPGGGEYSAELAELEAAVMKGAVYVLGKVTLKTSAHTNWFERFVINHLYRFLAINCRSALAFLDIPSSQFLQVGMTYQI